MATSTEHERLSRILRGQEALLTEVHQLLAEEQKQDDVLRAVVLSSRGHRPVSIVDPDPERIYHIDIIRGLCVRYRLRFLEAGLFKGPLPLQAVHAIRQLERSAPGPLSSFMIMAPASRFRLCDGEADPLLFVPLGDDRYYLVHKWGNDLSRTRAWITWPVRTPLNLTLTVVMLAMLVALAIPGSVLQQWGVHRASLMIWNTMVFGSFTVFGWMAFFGQFSTEAWNSRYFN